MYGQHLQPLLDGIPFLITKGLYGELDTLNVIRPSCQICQDGEGMRGIQRATESPATEFHIITTEHRIVRFSLPGSRKLEGSAAPPLLLVS